MKTENEMFENLFRILRKDNFFPDVSLISVFELRCFKLSLFNSKTFSDFFLKKNLEIFQNFRKPNVAFFLDCEYDWFILSSLYGIVWISVNE